MVYAIYNVNIEIINNTFAFANPWNIGHIIIADNVTNMELQNNIFYQPNTAAIYFVLNRSELVSETQSSENVFLTLLK